jgi:hypothetical protein
MSPFVIFLDVDGVICIKGKINYICLLYLKTIVEVTGANIVLSSNWRLQDEFKNSITKLLSERNIKIIGFTESIQDERVLEILTWIDQHKPYQWIVLDDRNLLSELISLKISKKYHDKVTPLVRKWLNASITCFSNHFVKTETYTGLQPKHIQSCIEKCLRSKVYSC